MRVRQQLLAWGVFGLTCVGVGVGGWLSAGGSRGRTQPADAVLALAFTAAGALIVSRRANPLGWLALLMSLSGVAYATDSYAAWAGAHRVAGATWSAWLGQWVWAPAGWRPAPPASHSIRMTGGCSRTRPRTRPPPSARR